MTTWRIPLSDVVVDDASRAALDDALASGWWSMGPRVSAFEEAFTEWSGTRHALAVANGTAALHLALLAVGCGPGDEVVLPSLTFVAAANTVVNVGARPVFCDIVGEDDLNLDPRDLERACRSGTRAVIALHYGGCPCDMGSVRACADNVCAAVIEDAAHAPGARIGMRPAGSLGDIGCFSFFSNKNLPIGEGGMITTDDEELAERVRLLRSHGMTTLTWDRHRGHAGSYDVLCHGLNLRLDELRAGLGLAQLRRLAEWNAERARLADLYRELLADAEEITCPFTTTADGLLPAHHLFVVLLPEGCSRDRVRAGLAEQGIQTSVHYPPIHTFTAFRRHAQRRLPRTEAVAGRILTLPLYPSLGDERVEAVVEALVDAVRSLPPSRPATTTAGRAD